MKREKKICFCFTPHRIVVAVLLVSSLVNLIVVGAVVEADSSDAPTATPSLLPSSGQATDQSLNVTLTIIVPTATELETFTPASTSTETASPTPSLTPTDTATATATFTSSPTPTQTLCTPRTYWPYLYIQRGDTLYSLALATGSTVNELMQANCLTDTRIVSGKLLYVPRLPIPTVTPTVTITPTEKTSVPTIFMNPSGNISLCSSLPYIYFSVLPFDQQGLKSVTVFYTINDNSWTAPMQPDGEIYYASATLSAEYSKIDFAYYSFSALDGSGNFTYSVEYKFTFPPCQEG